MSLFLLLLFFYYSYVLVDKYLNFEPTTSNQLRGRKDAKLNLSNLYHVIHKSRPPPTIHFPPRTRAVCIIQQQLRLIMYVRTAFCGKEERPLSQLCRPNYQYLVPGTSRLRVSIIHTVRYLLQTDDTYMCCIIILSSTIPIIL